MEKVNLNLLFKKPSNKQNFVVQSALTYRLKFETIMELFDTTDIFNMEGYEELYYRILKQYSVISSSLLYLFNDDNTDQMIAKANFKKFFNKLVICKMSNNEEAYKEYLEEISDNEVNKINNTKYMDLTDDDILTLVKHQIKYAIPSRRIAEEYEVHSESYIRRAKKVLEPYSELAQQYAAMSHFYSDAFIQDCKGLK